MLKNRDIKNILDRLYETYPDAKCELSHENPFQLIIATVLSAQTTDKKVNEVTERLFKKFRTPEDFLSLSLEELEKEIKVIGLYKSKAKHIQGLCKTLITNFNGVVPKDMESLLTLDGVGRKTANVVLSNAYNVPALAVDTHVFRVSNRIGLAKGKNVLEVEKQLMENINKEDWIKAHHTLIFHGRRTCKAINPSCSLCTINEFCEEYNKIRN
jgi:endonuclease III